MPSKSRYELSQLVPGAKSGSCAEEAQDPGDENTVSIVNQNTQKTLPGPNQWTTRNNFHLTNKTKTDVFSKWEAQETRSDMDGFLFCARLTVTDRAM